MVPRIQTLHGGAKIAVVDSSRDDDQKTLWGHLQIPSGLRDTRENVKISQNTYQADNP